jgi:hypothetical protein
MERREISLVEDICFDGTVRGRGFEMKILLRKFETNLRRFKEKIYACVKKIST